MEKNELNKDTVLDKTALTDNETSNVNGAFGWIDIGPKSGSPCFFCNKDIFIYTGVQDKDTGYDIMKCFGCGATALHHQEWRD